MIIKTLDNGEFAVEGKYKPFSGKVKVEVKMLPKRSFCQSHKISEMQLMPETRLIGLS